MPMRKNFTVPIKEILDKNQSPSPSQGEIVAQDNRVLFFKGKTAVYNITDLPFIEEFRLVDDVWCIFIHPAYNLQVDVLKQTITQSGLQFLYEFFYQVDLGEALKKFDTEYWRSTVFWSEVTQAKDDDDMQERMRKKIEN